MIICWPKHVAANGIISLFSMTANYLRLLTSNNNFLFLVILWVPWAQLLDTTTGFSDDPHRSCEASESLGQGVPLCPTDHIPLIKGTEPAQMQGKRSGLPPQWEGCRPVAATPAVHQPQPRTVDKGDPLSPCPTVCSPHLGQPPLSCS